MKTKTVLFTYYFLITGLLFLLGSFSYGQNQNDTTNPYIQNYPALDTGYNSSGENLCGEYYNINTTSLGELNSGITPVDMFYIKEENKLFILGTHKIMAYNTLNEDIEAIIEFAFTGQYDKKTDPALQQSDKRITYRQCLQGDDELFIVSDFNDLYSLNINTYEITKVCNLINWSEFSRERVIIEYDERTARIYLIIGTYPAKTHYFRINPDMSDPVELHRTLDVGILDFKLNTVYDKIYVTVEENNNIYKFQITDLDLYYYEQINLYYAPRHICYINDESCHKAICYPFITDAGGWSQTIYGFDGETDLQLQYNFGAHQKEVSSVYYDDISNIIYCAYSNDDAGLCLFNASDHSVIQDILLYTDSDEFIYQAQPCSNNKIILGGNNKVITIDNQAPYNWSVSRQYFEDHMIKLEYDDDLNKVYMLNYGDCSLDIFSTSGIFIESIIIGGGVFEGCYNSTNKDVYLFSNLSGFTQEIHIVNIETGEVFFKQITDIGLANISDMIYDIDRNRIYVSIFDESYNTSHLKIIDGDSREFLTEVINLTNSDHNCNNLFYFDNKLFCLTQNSNYWPYLDFIDLSTSTQHSTLLLQDFSPANYYSFFETDNNGNVLMSVDNFRAEDEGRLFIINSSSGTPEHTFPAQFPWDVEYNTENDKIYFRKNETNKIGLIENGNLSYITIGSDVEIEDIEYADFGNVLYILAGDVNHSYLYFLDGNTNTFPEEPLILPRLATRLKYNHINGKLYIHLPYNKDSRYTMGLIEFDQATHSINCGAMPHDQRAYSTFMYMRNELFIDETTNTLIIPGGYHSALYTVDLWFDHIPLISEPNGWTWLSFPRLQSNPMSSVTALTGNIDPENFTTGQMINRPPQSHSNINIDYSDGYWEPYLLTEVFSERGYKLTLSPEQLGDMLNFHGAVIDPGTTIDLYEGYQNWVGYFIPENQNIFDALPQDFLENCEYIKHQRWAVYNKNLPPPPAEDGCYPGWLCPDGMDLIVKYGEMVIIKPKIDMSFQWNEPVYGLQGGDMQMPEYYTYQEESDYTSLFIELDTTDKPVEIGAFVNDTCVGATVVNESDSIVLIRGYMDSIGTGEVVFEEYYGSNKSVHSVKITEYYVLSDNNFPVKQSIKSDTDKDYYLISFNGNSNESNIDNKQRAWLRTSPNPCPGDCYIHYYLPHRSNLSFVLYSIHGSEIARSDEMCIAEGISFDNIQNLLHLEGSMPDGIYFMRMIIENTSVTSKIIIN